LSKADLGLPKTIFTNYSRDVKNVIDSVGGVPLVIKLLEGTQGLGVVLAETENAAESVIEAFNGLEARVIVQEFIKEARGTAAIKAAETLKLGIAGVDMLPSARGPLILEVNSSPGLEGIERATGTDIATEIINYIERNKK